jgi:hypothetical protein
MVTALEVAFDIIPAYVRPLHAQHRQEHHRKAFRRQILHRRAELRLIADLHRRAIAYGPDRIELARWGFWPEEWKRNAHSRPQINARLETAADKPVFASSFRGRHCLVLADSFYEWQTLPSGKKQPYRIMLKSGEPFAMAGIYAATTMASVKQRARP